MSSSVQAQAIIRVNGITALTGGINAVTRDKITAQLEHNNIGVISKIEFDVNADNTLFAIVYFQDPVILADGRVTSCHYAIYNKMFWQHIMKSPVQLCYDPRVYDRAATVVDPPEYYTCELHNRPAIPPVAFGKYRMTAQLMEHRKQIAELTQTITEQHETIVELESKVNAVTNRCETLIYYLANDISPHSMWDPK